MTATHTAKWKQVQEQVRALVTNGDHPPGSRLPTEAELARRFDVHRHTLRKAIAALVDEGLIRTTQGSGMYVEEHLLDYPISRRTRFTETVERQNRSRGRRILETRIEVSDTRVARALEIRKGTKVLYLRSISEVDGRPVSLSHNWFNRRLCAGISRHARETDSITEALRRCGMDDYYRESTAVTARMPRREEAEALRQPMGRPVLLTESVDVDEEGRPIAYGRTAWAGDRVQVRF
ncbi:MAG: phosphonate metabolism transcriptional regulator PhnF [Gammaproteobacteria bacterium]